MGEGIRRAGVADIVIGIDPDSFKSGIAILDTDTRHTLIATQRFSDLLLSIKNTNEYCEANNKSLVVVVEAGWLNHGNWHINARMSVHKAESIGESVGSNLQTGRLICECVESMDIECVRQKPLKKIWHGQDHKISHAELKKFVNLTNTRTNQEERDALLLAWVYAGLPIKF